MRIQPLDVIRVFKLVIFKVIVLKIKNKRENIQPQKPKGWKFFETQAVEIEEEKLQIIPQIIMLKIPRTP